MRKLLDELYQYVDASVQTDEMHWLMICSAFAAAHKSLEDEMFWPGFVEGLVRLTLLLLGDCPDHRKRKGGKKRNDHYSLNRFRSLHYAQDGAQRVRVLFATSRFGFPNLTVSPSDAISAFRREHGYQASHRQFMQWYKQTFPSDYAKLF